MKYLISAFIVLWSVACNDFVHAGRIEGIPEPKGITVGVGQVALNSKTIIEVDPTFEKRYKSAVESLRTRIASLRSDGNIVRVSFKKVENSQDDSLSKEVISALKRDEGYAINIQKSEIIIRGKDNLALLHGLSTLEMMIVDGNGNIPEGIIADWPDHGFRALHLVLRGMKSQKIKEFINKARYRHFNVLILLLADNVRLPSMIGVARADAWSPQEFSGVVKYALENGLEVIPEMSLLTHQERLLKDAYPDLMFNKVTYDPRNPSTYKVIFSMMDEVIEFTKPRYFSIGHGEVAGFSEGTQKHWLRRKEKMLPPELFMKDVEKLNAYFKEKGIIPIMSGDMMIRPDEFPVMLPRHLHGFRGYAELRTRIPKNIMIADWHYADEQAEFPSAQAFAQLGHEVLGMTWMKEVTIRNFSRYIAQMKSGGKGMIASTWSEMQKGKWDSVDTIIQLSGDAFWNAR